MISNLSIINFRSYESINITLNSNINVLIGKNGQGKTNLLESIYFVSNIRSHRTKNDLDLIKHNEQYARITVENNENNKIDKIVCVIHQDGKYFSINDIAIKTTSEMLGTINTVLFYPTETTLFSDSPSIRRNFFDVELGKVSTIYTKNFQHFNRILKDRNKLLKADKVDEVLLEILTRQIIEPQVEIIKRREIFINYINERISFYLRKLINIDLKISIDYKSTLKQLNNDQLYEKYLSLIKRDVFTRSTNEGIHRDDYVIYSNNMEVDKHLSQGQIRIVLLAIKLVIVDFIYDKTNKRPILLLDDVMSELDEANQINLLMAIPKEVQTIITTTEENNLFSSSDINKIYIENSQVRK